MALTPISIHSRLTRKESVAWIIIGFGIFLRLFHYIDNRSLWLEEAFLSYNFFHRNFSELLSPPLDYDQQAPIGFLLIEKLFVETLGKNEYALRLFPLICGIIAIILFYKLASYFLSRIATAIALVCIAFSTPSVYHSVDVKQYSLELLVSITLYLAFNFYRTKIDANHMLKLGLIGGAAVWFSYSSIFILAGIGLALLWSQLINKQYAGLHYLFIAFFIWSACFLTNFFLFAFRGTQLQWMLDYWINMPAFVPFPPRSFYDIQVTFNLLRKIFDYPLGLGWLYTDITGLLRMSITGMICFVVGLIAWYRKSFEFFLAFVVPIILTFLASSLKLYPFFQRLLLFLLPSFLLVTVLGLETIYSWVSKYSTTTGKAILIFFVLPILFNASYLIVQPEKIYNRLDTREAIKFLNKHTLNGETVYDLLNHDMGIGKYKEGVILNCIKTIDDISINTHLIHIANKNVYDSNLNLVIDYKENKSYLPEKKFWILLNENLVLEEDEGFTIPIKQEDFIKNILNQSGATLEKEYRFEGIKILCYASN